MRLWSSVYNPLHTLRHVNRKLQAELDALTAEECTPELEEPVVPDLDPEEAVAREMVLECRADDRAAVSQFCDWENLSWQERLALVLNHQRVNEKLQRE